MNDPTIGREDETLKAAVRDGLAARDRALPAPRRDKDHSKHPGTQNDTEGESGGHQPRGVHSD